MFCLSLHRCSKIGLSFGLCAAVAALTSCGQPSTQNQAEVTAQTEFSTERCESLISTAIQSLGPKRLNIDAELPTALATLNQWMGECGKPEDKHREIDGATYELIKKVVPSPQAERLSDLRFSQRDGLHVRDCLLAKQVSDFATATSDNNLDRIVDLFEYVNRNVDLQQPTENSPPTTMFTAFFFGQGSAEDRALLFVSFLRQMGIDSVILHPQAATATADEKTTKRPWLVGVLLDGGIYLFDTRLGTPIPSAADTGESVTVRKPATLAEVKQNDGLLRTLDVPGGRAYGLEAQDLSAVRVQVVGTASFWAPRLERLQAVLVGDRATVVYDPLEDQDNNPGVLKRVVEAGAGHWQKSDVSLWAYPESALDRFEKRTPDQQRAYDVKQMPFRAPILFDIDPAGQARMDAETNMAKMGAAKAEHQRARIHQMVGEFKSAIPSYANSRMDEQFPPGLPVYPEHRLAHQQAADNSTFWNAVCLLEQDDPAAAITALRSYLRRHQKAPEQGPWVGLSRGLLAITLAEQGQHKAAIAEMGLVPASDPKKDGYDFLVERWKKHVAKSQDPKSPQQDAKPAGEAKSSEPGSGPATDADAKDDDSPAANKRAEKSEGDTAAQSP